MNQVKSCRVREETIERFVTGHLKGGSLSRFEEHLLLCGQCQDRVESADLYVGAMKQALKGLREVPADERRTEPRQFYRQAVTVRMQDGPETLVGRTIDISRSGVGLTLRVKVAQGSRVHLAAGGEQYNGEIAWCAAQGASYRVGVRLCA